MVQWLTNPMFYHWSYVEWRKIWALYSMNKTSLHQYNDGKDVYQNIKQLLFIKEHGLIGESLVLPMPDVNICRN